jgi:crossover junction endodeoxyribonuclease RuvC
MKILGIDPGYARVGWGIIDYANNKPAYLSCDCIETPALKDFSLRLGAIYEQIEKIIEDNKVDCMAIENLFFNTNQKTAILVSQARGVIILAGVQAKIPVYDYTPLQVKNALIGYGRADKKQIQTMLKYHLNIKTDFKQDDAADAVAIALTHAYSNKGLK